MNAIDQKKYEYEGKNRITVGDLRKQLQGYSSDTEVMFGNCINGNPLIFYRVKSRGDLLVQIELNEVTEDFL